MLTPKFCWPPKIWSHQIFVPTKIFDSQKCWHHSFFLGGGGRGKQNSTHFSFFLTKIDPPGGRGVPRFFSSPQILFFFWVKLPCNILEPYDNPFWEKSYPAEREKREEKITPLISVTAHATTRTNMDVNFGVKMVVNMFVIMSLNVFFIIVIMRIKDGIWLYYTILNSIWWYVLLLDDNGW